MVVEVIVAAAMHSYARHTHKDTNYSCHVKAIEIIYGVYIMPLVIHSLQADTHTHTDIRR